MNTMKLDLREIWAVCEAVTSQKIFVNLVSGVYMQHLTAKVRTEKFKRAPRDCGLNFNVKIQV